MNTKKVLVLVLSAVLMTACTSPDGPPVLPLGSFMDDYDIRYTISDSAWVMMPTAAYTIDERMDEEQVVILKLPATDSTDVLWTRVDWMIFKDMKPWTWGFCYTGWDMPSREEVLTMQPANRQEPRTGCGGFPFSRMKPSS